MSESFVDIDTSDAVEPMCVEPGEYQIRIFDLLKDKEGNLLRTDKNDGKFFMPIFELPAEIAAKTFSKFVGLPNSTMDEKKLNNSKFQLESFKKAFGITEAGFDLNDLIGRECYAILGKEDNGEYGEQNFVKKFIAGA